MKKKIAIIVRDRKSEALRMAVGATLSNDEVSVFIMDDKLEMDDDTSVNIEMLSDLKAKIFSNNPENPFEQKTTEEIARMLSEYDVVIPY
ncbi:MAG: hypothetical protein HZC49_08215 [Nitrospirae bacterium]|nr:hypothetical protein [Nitrospirota bacterium]